MQHFAYEKSFLKLVAIDSKHVVAAGGSVGISTSATLLETTDGGATWDEITLEGHGYGFGLDYAPDGTGFAVTCPIGGSQPKCAIWSTA